jgi:hypothetical protein
VCEVLSSSSEALDRGKKLGIYARERVAHAWLAVQTSSLRPRPAGHLPFLVDWTVLPTPG